jgi:hypothetical protein
MKPIVALLLSLIAIPAAFGAGNSAGDFFARLAGDWQGAGEVRGMASAQLMSWEPVLDGIYSGAHSLFGVQPFVVFTQLDPLHH